MGVLKLKDVSSLPLLVLYWIATINLTWAGSSEIKQQDYTAINTTGTNNNTAEAMVFAFLDKTLEPSTETANLRVKRQSGGKYTDASKMSQMKLLRLILQMVRNLWASSYIGGAHPLHHEVPKPVAELYKNKVLSIFFPKEGHVNEQA